MNPPRKIKIAARKSDLARLQAFRVGEALKKAHPDLEIEFLFRESLGDKNLGDPLWKMPEKGVFTSDFVEDLVQGNVDMVVHSWKDLPLEHPSGTEIVATLPRADMRDLLLIRKDRFLRTPDVLKVLSSSPRRAYNLEPFLKKALPRGVKSVVFETVRGNVPTRVRKLFEQEVDGLIVAKAAVDRLLSAEEPEFLPMQHELRERLRECHFMVLPIVENPTAAAQGALAVEIQKDREELRKLLVPINDPITFQSVQREREILGAYGGGCHQKIGVSILPRSYGTICVLRGLTDKGEVLSTTEVSNDGFWKGKRYDKDEVFPLEIKATWFQREALDVKPPSQDIGFYVARGNALPATWSTAGRLIWTAGVETWFKLAARGVWVHGTSGALGDRESMDLEILIGKPNPRFARLTHAGAPERGPFENVATYRLVPDANAPNIDGKKSFFWSSGSQFLRALELNPWIRDMDHASGPGHTLDVLRETLGPQGKIRVFLNHSDWLKEVVR